MITVLIRQAVDDVAAYGPPLLLISHQVKNLLRSPINSFTLSRYFFLCLPLSLLPAILPVIVRFSRLSALITWPRNTIYRVIKTAKSSLLLPIAFGIFALLLLSVHLNLSIFLQRHISIASSLPSISLLTFHAPQLYSSIDHTYVLRGLIFVSIEIRLLHLLISVSHLASAVNTLPR